MMGALTAGREAAAVIGEKGGDAEERESGLLDAGVSSRPAVHMHWSSRYSKSGDMARNKSYGGVDRTRCP